LERPKGPFPSLPGGIDERMKHYFDGYRGSLPPILKGLLPGKLWGQIADIKKVRSWQANGKPLCPTPHGVVSLIAAFDDLLERNDGFLSIIDFKTRGSIPEAGYAERYSQSQADLYLVHLKLSGRNPHPETFFIFCTPHECDQDYTLPDCVPIRFDVTVQSVIAHYDDGMDLITEGAKILSGTRPDAGVNCAFCLWAESQFQMRPVVDPTAPVMT